MSGILALVPVFAAGLIVVSCVNHESFAHRLGDTLPTAFGSGSALLFLVFLILCWLGPVPLVAIHLVVVLLVALRLICRNKLPRGSSKVVIAKKWSVSSRLILVLFALLMLGILLLTLTLPLLDWDARILWALKAKILTAEGTVVSNAFRDPYRLHIHPRYPLLLPWIAAFIAQHHGVFSEGHYQVLLSLFGLFAIWQLNLLLRRQVSPGEAHLLSLVALLSGCWLQAQFNSAIEIVLVFFLLSALVVLWRWFDRPQTADILLTSLLLFGLAMTKNEGFLLALAVICGFTVVVMREQGAIAALRNGGVLASGFLLLSSSWVAHLYFIPPVSDENYLTRLHVEFFLHGWSRFPEILHTVLERMLDVRVWHVIWLLPLVLPWVAWRRKVLNDRNFLLLSIIFVIYFSGVMLVYLLSPWRDIALHVAVTFDRVMLPLLPIILLLFSVVSGSGRKGATP